MIAKPSQTAPVYIYSTTISIVKHPDDSPLLSFIKTIRIVNLVDYTLCPLYSGRGGSAVQWAPEVYDEQKKSAAGFYT